MKIVIFLILLIFTQSLNAEKNYSDASITDILLIKDDGSSTPDLIYNDIVSLGYSVNTIIPSLITYEFVKQHRLVILSTGGNVNACSNNNMRFILESHLDNEGKLIIEGGENGYVASVYPQYPGFRNKVLKITNWTSHNGGDLIMSNVHLQSNLANVPNKLPVRIQFNFSQNFDQDVCTNNEFSELFYKTNLYNNSIGVLVAPSVDNPKIINFFFNYSAVSFRSDGKNLLANSIYNLIGNSVLIHNISNEIPSKFQLYQNYPNPFNPSTIIRFDLNKSSFVKLTLYDALGREISQLVNEFIVAGSYEYKFENSRSLQSGIYFYHIVTHSDKLATDSYKEATNYSETKKMLLIK